ncbi:hypothetical protein A8V01_02955 [Novosphingobium guangzhouense]|uniref:Spore coat protein U/FanG domain-containing protein n=1 Tax=Novosphingobium guangzhouense TaxID=1850347 RepID=A0A2K2G6G2_9SPHN|nr:hypothetical protein A8V01_02955 [Novosphingobium guangzhouense]
MVGFIQEGNPRCQNAILPDFNGADMTLVVNAERPTACIVEAGNPANLGTVPTTAVNTTGSTTISVTCPANVPYYVGLMPSNGNSDGLGSLAGTSGNPDTPNYQLRSISDTGPIWGDTATTTSVGNGVGGTGTGAADAIPVYVSVPSANYRPDTYTDTVTVHVRY